jgi:hypothetical protein
MDLSDATEKTPATLGIDPRTFRLVAHTSVSKFFMSLFESCLDCFSLKVQSSKLSLCIVCFQSVEATFIDELKNFFLPFVLRCEQEAAGSRKQFLHDYLIHLSSEDLSLPQELFEHLRDGHSCELVPSLEEKISLALDCLYAYPKPDQLNKAFHILECVRGRGFR